MSGDWEAPPKSVLTCISPSNVSYRRVAPEPTVLEQFSQAMWAMLQYWNSVRGALGKGYGRAPLSLEIEFYVSNTATELPKCSAPLMAGYVDQKLEFLDSLEIKAHNISYATFRRTLQPVFYPAPLLPIVLAARELRTLALRVEVLSDDLKTGALDNGSDGGTNVPRVVPGVTSMTSSNLTRLLSRVATYRSLKSAQFELFVTRPLRDGAPDLLSRTVRDISYFLTEFRVYISHISSEIFALNTYDDDNLQDRWQEMKSYSLAFGDQDAWGDAYFFSTGPNQRTRTPRLERLEPFLRASVEHLIRMPKIERWEVGCSIFHFPNTTTGL